MNHPSNFIDLTGIKYDNFIVLKQGKGRYTKGGQYKTTWICECICAKEFETDGEKIRRGTVYSCGCMRYKGRGRFYDDLTGKQFGKLVVLGEGEPTKNSYGRRSKRWMCLCDCGNTTLVHTDKLKSGHTRSCGCLKDEFSIGDLTRTHGMSNTKLYHTYQSMIQRCYYPKNVSYKNYGGRGIKICEEWLGEHGFENFYEWAMEEGYDKNKSRTDQSIDRIDVNGNYEPSNCRFADWSTQVKNRRK